ncbi:MAG: DUF1926 domain-containing protein [Planctomycetes bacterium]|nr:DUF1926 domain-containing protein [Planctomycetota bacterium]
MGDITVVSETDCARRHMDTTSPTPGPAPTVNFIFALHDHQPVGNFDSVLDQAFDQAYAPFLDVVEAHPGVRFSLHTSGPLLDWLEARRPAYLDRVRRLVAAGRCEILGGAYYEPILPMLPRRDRVGQLRDYGDHLEMLFGARPRGAWLAERVWEQGLASAMAEAGVEFTVLDDSHFKAAGIPPADLSGYFTTEDEGRLLKVFPIDEDLRYAIPWKDPEATIECLRGYATADGARVAVYADDGEKFGGWPRTHKLIYRERWLDRLFTELERNASWLRMTHFAEALDRLPPRGRIWLPDCSYREMGEWVLPPASLTAYEGMVEELKRAGLFERARHYLRGGSWRNFRARYPEAAQMYAKMLEVSGRVAALGETPGERAGVRAEARRDLYRGQCNCAYWHGVFGGLYLPHLRDAIYRHLLRAEKACRPAGPFAETVREDFDRDGREEVRLSNAALNVYVAPARGGHVYELDLLAKDFNLMNGLSRRPEAYHRNVGRAVYVENLETAVGIDNQILAKRPGLDRLLIYDAYARETLVEHFFADEPHVDEVAAGRAGERGDFVPGEYRVTAAGGAGEAALTLVREGAVTVGDGGGAGAGAGAGPGEARRVRVAKVLRLPEPERALLEVRYEVTNLAAARLDTVFAVETNFSLLAGNAHDRFYVDGGGRNVGPLVTVGDFREQEGFGLVDEWQGIAVRLGWSAPAGVWIFPVQTVSNSEGGFEAVYQNSVVLPRWRLALGPGERWTATLRIQVHLPQG